MFKRRSWAVPESLPVPDLPEPSAELILRMAEISANVRFIERHFSKKEATRYLADISDSLGLQEASYNVLKFRPRSDDRKVFTAMRQAQAWWRQALAVALRLNE
jgi:hypothetical protein